MSIHLFLNTHFVSVKIIEVNTCVISFYNWIRKIWRRIANICNIVLKHHSIKVDLDLLEHCVGRSAGVISHFASPGLVSTH